MNGTSDFAQIYDEHAAGVFRAALRVVGDPQLAEDVTQDVFLTFWRGSAFDGRRGALGPYLRLMARSRALDHWRRDRAGERATARLRERAVIDSPEPQPADAVLRAADRQTARAAVKALPVAQRQAIGLTFWGGLTVQQAAAAEGIPLGTAKSRVRLALQKLADDPALAAAS
jgi:RNA polymerase sigma-70 factor (ECF subfamily)